MAVSCKRGLLVVWNCQKWVLQSGSLRLWSVGGSPMVQDSGIDCRRAGSVWTCRGTREADVVSVRRASEERRTEGNWTVDRVQRVQACQRVYPCWSDWSTLFFWTTSRPLSVGWPQLIVVMRVRRSNKMLNLWWRIAGICGWLWGMRLRLRRLWIRGTRKWVGHLEGCLNARHCWVVWSGGDTVSCQSRLGVTNPDFRSAALSDSAG